MLLMCIQHAFICIQHACSCKLHDFILCVACNVMFPTNAISVLHVIVKSCCCCHLLYVVFICVAGRHTTCHASGAKCCCCMLLLKLFVCGRSCVQPARLRCYNCRGTIPFAIFVFVPCFAYHLQRVRCCAAAPAHIHWESLRIRLCHLHT